MNFDDILSEKKRCRIMYTIDLFHQTLTLKSILFIEALKRLHG